jgi:hypothetical protein
MVMTVIGVAIARNWCMFSLKWLDIMLLQQYSLMKLIRYALHVVELVSMKHHDGNTIRPAITSLLKVAAYINDLTVIIKQSEITNAN